MKTHFYLLRFFFSGLFLAFVLTGTTGCHPSPAVVIANPLPVELGDPYILQAPDHTFYLYGTTEGLDGFKAYSSRNLSDWKDEGVVYSGATRTSWTAGCFWAPEVYRHNDRYYMFFSADWKENPRNEQENFRIGVAVSDSPAGPFRELAGKPLFDPGYPVIDANVWFDDDGRIYLYYSRCCYKHPVESQLSAWARSNGLFDRIEESWIYGVELEPDFSGVRGEPVLLLRPPFERDDRQAEWESRSVTSGEVNRRWTEGSFLFRRGDRYYMMYSANYYGGENYAVGYAVARSPLGPFTKSADNPVLEKNTSRGGIVTGTGHNSVLTLADGRMFCVYHGRTRAAGKQRVVFIDSMQIDPAGRLKVFGPTTRPDL